MSGQECPFCSSSYEVPAGHDTVADRGLGAAGLTGNPGDRSAWPDPPPDYRVVAVPSGERRTRENETLLHHCQDGRVIAAQAPLYGTFDEAQELMEADLAVPVISDPAKVWVGSSVVEAMVSGQPIAKAAAVPPPVRGGRERAAVSGRGIGKTAAMRGAVARQAAEAFERAPTVGPAWMCIDATTDHVRIAIGRGIPGLDPPAYDAAATPLAAAEVIAEIGRVCRPKNGFIDYSGFGLAHLRDVRAAWQQVGLAWVFTEVRS